MELIRVKGRSAFLEENVSERLTTFSNVQQRIADDDSFNAFNLDDALFTSRETCRNA